MARTQEEAGQVVLWVKMKGRVRSVLESRRRATGKRALVKMAAGGRR